MAGSHDSGNPLLHELLDKMRLENRKQMVHCLTVVSRLSTSLADKRDVGLHYEKLFKTCQAKYQGEGPTGLLLVYPQHCVHLMEASWDIIIEVVQNLNSMTTLGGMLTESKTLIFSPNISIRMFPQWAQRVLNVPALPKGEIYRTNESIETTIGSSVKCIYKLGAHLSKLSQHQLKGTMDTLATKLPNLLLQQDVIEYYLSVSDLNSPSQFLQRYDTPSHVVLDSELVWPLPEKLFPYDD